MKRLHPWLSGEEDLPHALRDYPQGGTGPLRVGERFLFFRRGLRTWYLPVERIVWAFLRQEDSSTTICCGRTSFASYYLMLVLAGGDAVRIPVEHKGAALQALELLRQRNAKIETGYTPERAQRLAMQLRRCV